MDQTSDKPHMVIATPLFPPDIAEPAPYVKELLLRLADTYNVSALIYGELPESVPGVSFISISKNRPLFSRLFSYTYALFRLSQSNSIIYAQNGASVELPAAIVSRLRNIPLIIRFADTASIERAKQNHIFKWIETLVQKQARYVIAATGSNNTTRVPDPLPRPEILPFRETDQAEVEAFESSWQEHLTQLKKLFASCR